jgi:hypothetical protein
MAPKSEPIATYGRKHRAGGAVLARHAGMAFSDYLSGTPVPVQQHTTPALDQVEGVDPLTNDSTQEARAGSACPNHAVASW